MRLPVNSTWGPHPIHALLPAVVMLAFSGWVWFANRGPLPALPVAVVALRPVDGTAAATEMPIEVRYGVPTERTLHLWAPAG
jgi:hypothetical protein